MGIYTIYKATNTRNKKLYVGFDSNWPKRRREHKNGFSTNDNVFYRAIRKHGWDSFEWEILYQSKDKDHTKNVMENYFIVEYNSYIHFKNSNGYNMTLGGEGTLGNKPTKQTMEKIRNVWKEKYGENITNVFQLYFIKEKSKETCLREYGYEYASKNPEIKKKVKQTCLSTYGVECALQDLKIRETSLEKIREKYNDTEATNISQIKEIKQKKINTSLKNWGVKHTMQSPIVKNKALQTIKNKPKEKKSEETNKRKHTCYEKYGVEYITQLPETKTKIKETILKKYGVEHISKSPEFQEKKKGKFKEKYGVDNPSKLPFLSIIKTRKTYSKNILSRCYPEFKRYY